LISGAWRRAAIARRNATGFSDILAVSNREFVEAGGLMSYGPNFPDLFRRAGDYVERFCAAPSLLTFRSNSRPSSTQGARARNSANAARSRRRGDRMKAGAPGDLLNQSPVRNRLRSRRFSSATSSRSTFRGKRTGNRAWSALRSDASKADLRRKVPALRCPAVTCNAS
jgi:hypothetical protein